MLIRIGTLINLMIIALFLPLLFSCNPRSSESDALKKNHEGINYMNDGKYEKALAAFYEAIKSDGLKGDSKGTVYRNIALTFQQLDNQDSSIHYYTIAAKTFRKNSYDYLVNMANVDMLTNKTGNAITKLLKASALSPEDLSVNNSLGLIYLGYYGEEFTDPERALPYNKTAFDISNSRMTEDLLARNYYQLGKYEIAEMHFDNIHVRYPDNVLYTLNNGMTKYKLKKTAEAELLFKKVLEQDSSYKGTIENFKLINR